MTRTIDARRDNARRGEQGFTLMEMLVSVAIISILVAIAIPTFTGHLERARAATDIANVRSGYADLSAKMILADGDDYAFGGYVDDDDMYGTLTFILLADGTVERVTSAGYGASTDTAYVTVGNSEDLTNSRVGTTTDHTDPTHTHAGVTIGGIELDSSNGDSWIEGQNIYYYVTNRKVTQIQGVAV